MGLQIQILRASTSREIDTAFAHLHANPPDALFVSTMPSSTVRVPNWSKRRHTIGLPAIYTGREYPKSRLMSYGTNIADAFRQAGVYAGRILKARSPRICPWCSRPNRAGDQHQPPGRSPHRAADAARAADEVIE